MKYLKTNSNIILFLCLFICQINLMAQEWERTFDLGEPNQIGSAITTSPDGDYVIAGYTRDTSSGFNPEVLIVSATPEGDSLWSNTIPINKTGFLSVGQIKLNHSGNAYYISGFSNTGLGADTSFIIKINLAGQQLSTHFFSELDRVHDFIETPEGDLILAGGRYDPNSAELNPFIAKAMRIEADGSILWEVEYEYGNLIISILEGENGSYIIGGTQELFPPGIPVAAQYGFLVQITENGLAEWIYAQNPDVFFNRSVKKVLRRDDGSFMLLGNYVQSSQFGTMIQIVSPEGVPGDLYLLPNMSRTQLDFEYCSVDDQIYSFGFISSSGNQDYQFTLFSPEAVEVDMISGSNSNKRIGRRLMIDTEGAIAGTGYHEVEGRDLVMLVKADLSCTPSSSTEDITNESLKLTLSPNPVRDVCKFELAREISEDLQLSIYNSKGQFLEQWPVHGTTFHWNRKSLPSGLYFYQLQSPEQTIVSGKIVLD
ncbi:MAG: T9SS type A sorting domain-containing protein [Chitinophagales bacterium]|nr:T9SS type A sorting domain-containing protein [Chitinophagales bacterium]